MSEFNENPETYKRGVKFTPETPGLFVKNDIHYMAEKPGWIGKTIIFDKTDPNFKNLPDFENLKADILKATSLADDHLRNHLPEYHFTFEEPSESTPGKVTFFMEEVSGNSSANISTTGEFPILYTPLPEVDDYLASGVGLYTSTFTDDKGVELEYFGGNVIYGNTQKNEQKKLYLIDFYPYHITTYEKFKDSTFYMMRQFLRKQQSQNEAVSETPLNYNSYFPKTLKALDKLNLKKFGAVPKLSILRREF